MLTTKETPVSQTARHPDSEKLYHTEKEVNPIENKEISKDRTCKRNACSTNSTARGRAASARDRGICSQKEFSTQRKKSILIENFTDISKDDNCKRNALFHKQQRAASAQARGIRACARHPRLTAASVRRKSLSHRERSQSYRELYRPFQR